MRPFITTLSLAALLAAPAASQDLPRVLTLPASARAMGLGDAYPAGSDHADAIFYDPALVDGASGFGLDVQRWDAASTSFAASAAAGWWGGGVAVGLQSLDHLTTASGSGQSALFSEGLLPVSERVASLAFAKEVKDIEMGVVAKWVERRFTSVRATAPAFDLGVAKEAGRVTFALSARNLGPELDYGSVTAALPRTYTLGAAAYGKPLGPLDVGFAARVSYDEDTVIPGGGLEFGYWPVQGRTFVARVGAQRTTDDAASPLTLGFSYWGDDLVLEWAFQPWDVDGEAGTHRIAVRWR